MAPAIVKSNHLAEFGIIRKLPPRYLPKAINNECRSMLIVEPFISREV